MVERFEGLHFPLRRDASLGGLHKETDYPAYVRQLIKQLLLTAPGERVNRPDFGAGIRRLLFAPTDDATASLLETTVFQNLERWLGNLIRVDEVRTAFGDGRLEVTVVYTLKARGDQEVLNLEVTE